MQFIIQLPVTVSEPVCLCHPQEYKLLFEGAGSNPGDKTLEDRFFEHEVTHTQPNREAYLTYIVGFYSYLNTT